MANIAVIDNEGTIIVTNKSWDNFAIENGGQLEKCSIGANYLDECKKFDNEQLYANEYIYDNIVAVIQGKKPFYILEYPCHSPDKKRWFLLYVTPICLNDSEVANGAVVSHINITDYKLIEEKFKEVFMDNTSE